ncbi:hypothetical protein D3C71_1828990 [compost metagenome]
MAAYQAIGAFDTVFEHGGLARKGLVKVRLHSHHQPGRNQVLYQSSLKLLRAAPQPARLLLVDIQHPHVAVHPGNPAGHMAQHVGHEGFLGVRYLLGLMVRGDVGLHPIPQHAAILKQPRR